MKKFKALLLVVFIGICNDDLHAQRYLTEVDSSLFIRDTLRPLVKRLENLRFSGYIQPQFQVAQQKGTHSFAGGNFAENSDNRFMIRRSRLKLDYLLPGSKHGFPRASFTFQFDVNERQFTIRDMFVRLYQQKQDKFSFTMGIFARPFGYEVNLSSSFRESPERGRASQIMMPSERDLGAMVTYDYKTKGTWSGFKLDAGLFNGQGITGPTDFDSYKDFASRLTIKPFHLSENMMLSAGGSILRGGWMQATKFRYELKEEAGKKLFVADTNVSNIGKKVPRRYYGADLQLIVKHGWGKTELRGEYWLGKQSGSNNTLNSPATLPLTPTYIRKFDAAFFYFIQNIVNENWEAVVKYDWFDTNRDVKGNEIGAAGTNLTTADIRYSTLGLGLTRYFSENLKILGYYDIVRNEKTLLPGFTDDIRDNVFTLRLQFRF